MEFVNDPSKTGDAVVYIEGLIQMKTNFSNLVENQFGCDKILVKKLNAAFEHFVNDNPRSAEFLSLYMDEKMRKGLAGMVDDEVDMLLAPCCSVLDEYWLRLRLCWDGPWGSSDTCRRKICSSDITSNT